MGRWLPAMFFCLLLLASCAEEWDNSYPENTQNKALKAWMKLNRPELLENYQQEGDYYVDVISLGDLADSAIRETDSWVRYEITGRSLQGDISITRDSVYALQQGSFTKYTHYVPYYKYCGPVSKATFKEGTHLVMRNVVTLGEQYAAERGLPREVELRKGSKVVLYMPATIISTKDANGDGGYEGQYALSANHPMISRVEVTDRLHNPVEAEGVAVDEFAAQNGGLDPKEPEDPEDAEPETTAAAPYTWRKASLEAAQVYFNETYTPHSDDAGLFTYRNPYVGSQQTADEIDRKINKALIERFGESKQGKLIDQEKTVRVWYIIRFLDGFVQSTNIDEVKQIVYGDVESGGRAMSYNPSLNKDAQIAAWYYALPYFRYGSWGAILTVSSSAYGASGIVGMTNTNTSSDMSSTYAMMNYYGMMNSYYGNGNMNNYYDNYYGGYMGGLYDGSTYSNYSGDTSTTTTTITEVLPFTPLLIEFYLEPEK